MKLIDDTLVVSIFIIFCRIGACLSIVPGLSSPRLPMRARLFLAFGVTLALAPAFLDQARAAVGQLVPATLALLIVAELLIGSSLGLMARMMMAGLETMGTAASMAMGMSSMFAPRVDENDQLPDIAGFIALGAVTLFFITNQHFEILRALADSYTPYPIGAALDFGRALERISHTLGEAFLLSLRLMSPILVFSIISNFSFALLNKLTPQIAIFFISPPFVLAGGLVIFYFSIDKILFVFNQAFAAMLARG